MTTTDFYIGVMSGTSLDGVDIALVRIDSDEVGVINNMSLEHSHFEPMPNHLKTNLASISRDAEININLLGQLDRKVSEFFATAVNTLLDKTQLNENDITAIGNHGITIRHRPDLEPNFTMQIGDPNTLAQLTNIDVVSDLRRMDMAAGGEGAPLVPPFHQALFGNKLEKCIILNLGGIANITVLNGEQDIIGYDTGPANTLINAWHLLHQGSDCDRNGVWASTGTCHSGLLNELLDEGYFSLPYPKSTGKELFNLDWLHAKLSKISNRPSEQDIQTTLTHLTALTVANEVNKFTDIKHLLVCGGGYRNEFLMTCLSNYLPHHSISSTSAYGGCPDTLEAMAFAWLAFCRVNNVSANCPSVTGASRQVVLGGWYKAS